MIAVIGRVNGLRHVADEMVDRGEKVCQSLTILKGRLERLTVGRIMMSTWAALGGFKVDHY